MFPFDDVIMLSLITSSSIPNNAYTSHQSSIYALGSNSVLVQTLNFTEIYQQVLSDWKWEKIIDKQHIEYNGLHDIN